MTLNTKHGNRVYIEMCPNQNLYVVKTKALPTAEVIPECPLHTFCFPQQQSRKLSVLETELHEEIQMDYFITLANFLLQFTVKYGHLFFMLPGKKQYNLLQKYNPHKRIFKF